MLIALIILAWLLVNSWIMLLILVNSGCIIENEELCYIAIGAVLSPLYLLVVAFVRHLLDKRHK